MSRLGGLGTSVYSSSVWPALSTFSRASESLLRNQRWNIERERRAYEREQDRKEQKKAEKKAKKGKGSGGAKGAGSGAVTGAITGAIVGGPVGAVVGAGLGAAGGHMGGQANPEGASPYIAGGISGTASGFGAGIGAGAGGLGSQTAMEIAKQGATQGAKQVITATGGAFLGGSLGAAGGGALNRATAQPIQPGTLPQGQPMALDSTWKMGQPAAAAAPPPTAVSGDPVPSFGPGQTLQPNLAGYQAKVRAGARQSGLLREMGPGSGPPPQGPVAARGLPPGDYGRAPGMRPQPAPVKPGGFGDRNAWTRAFAGGMYPQWTMANSPVTNPTVAARLENYGARTGLANARRQTVEDMRVPQVGAENALAYQRTEGGNLSAARGLTVSGTREDDIRRAGFGADKAGSDAFVAEQTMFPRIDKARTDATTSAVRMRVDEATEGPATDLPFWKAETARSKTPLSAEKALVEYDNLSRQLSDYRVKNGPPVGLSEEQLDAWREKNSAKLSRELNQIIDDWIENTPLHPDDLAAVKRGFQKDWQWIAPDKRPISLEEALKVFIGS